MQLRWRLAGIVLLDRPDRRGWQRSGSAAQSNAAGTLIERHGLHAVDALLGAELEEPAVERHERCRHVPSQYEIDDVVHRVVGQ